MRPDIILVSEATGQLILLELTVPKEERMEEEQVEDQVYAGGSGLSGFASYSLSKAYGTLGITGASRRGAMSINVEAAEKAG